MFYYKKIKIYIKTFDIRKRIYVLFHSHAVSLKLAKRFPTKMEINAIFRIVACHIVTPNYTSTTITCEIVIGLKLEVHYVSFKMNMS